ncbi:hypothetical protein SADUNF_Sadunf01G0121100 [Salix dunnii]|uniref:Uncharacterized protein n=1 Tax=Salix dunnii TaxID=1413687 RepID=A0A835TKA8_9ROSI|nr:hypothetical protein SADUNF_Sadunf01G0121100 [Salix dunnii]
MKSLQYLAFTRLDLSFSIHKEGDQDDRCSNSAYCVFMGTNLISWQCKQQFIVARSSIKSEYKSLANIASEIQWMQSLLS